MAGIHRYEGKSKFVVLRRDGTMPQWPSFLMGARDPAAPAGIRAYADAAESLGFDPKYVSDLRVMADEFEGFRAEHGDGDPDAPLHRVEHPIIPMIEDNGGLWPAESSCWTGLL